MALPHFPIISSISLSLISLSFNSVSYTMLPVPFLSSYLSYCSFSFFSHSFRSLTFPFSLFFYYFPLFFIISFIPLTLICSSSLSLFRSLSLSLSPVFPSLSTRFLYHTSVSSLPVYSFCYLFQSPSGPLSFSIISFLSFPFVFSLYPLLSLSFRFPLSLQFPPSLQFFSLSLRPLLFLYFFFFIVLSFSLSRHGVSRLSICPSVCLPFVCPPCVCSFVRLSI